ncbi:MAG: NAD(P)H-dependent oxidoreductase [Mycoplasmataceae bacterium]|nr:NAD(P)H-dependent oxidoreductase [Mycoplasmataceae bacterium]
MKKILIIQAHNNFEKSLVNKELISVAKEMENVEIIDIYDRYKGSKVGWMDKGLISEDRKIAMESDVIVYQFPFHWYTSPPMLDNWIEWFLGYGWAHGGKYSLKDKEITVSYTAGEVKSDYTKNGVSLYDSDEFIKRFIATANYCQMKWVDHFKVIGASHLKDGELDLIKKDYKQWLTKIAK